MLEQLNKLETEAGEAAAQAESLAELDAVRVRYLGRKGLLTDVLRSVSQLPAEERPAAGQAANVVKNRIQDILESRNSVLAEHENAKRARQNRIDLSLPGRVPYAGHLHVITQVTQEIVSIFRELGFQLGAGPEVETEYYNFDSLNTPADHPARDLHDTFFVKPGVVLRTHTSPVQMRIMEKNQPPVAVVVPGRVYRVDADATHSPMFFQIEGLLVDEGVTFADLKGVIMRFIHRFFGPNTTIRFRPHFFPFTEPSAEVDILWTSERNGQRQEKWLEIMGCGMVHPAVFEHAGYDYERYTGFAFGMGLDRIAMVRHQIPAITYLYENDLRFLEQF
ncbi:MAG: phenylalanine--tRNA ligase alpha subunit [Candidatus Hydrogenedentota bacterium]